MKQTTPPNEPTIWEFIGYPPSGMLPVHKTGSKTLKLPRRPDVLVSLYQCQGKAFAEVEHFQEDAIWFAWLWDKPVNSIESREFGYLLSELKEVASSEVQD